MIQKLICAQCGKEDFKECVLEDGKTFCCAVCGATYKQDAASQAKEKEQAGEEPNVCKFC